ncbi:kinesin-like protein KIF24 isoform X1 [Bufo bufo]|uniref:kinesin-like protein KIF24 isoform X1 n=1 Tax=Bufo bufo TaxID=8384 RepID=UPI001ABE2359|nr:kinesin-like protein KIF24 isoform X1 [Bufo bufo]XP_040277117.1 kinesin-like protein KIF24 isoform X1 [Bufo bufo]
MASCLLECLCEADLEQYYPHFVAHGLQKIEELAKVTMRDYSKLGVHSMEDRKRLFQLIKIIQSVAAEESNDGQTPPLQPGCVYLQPPGNRSATRRQLQFDISFETDRNVFPSSHHVTGLCEPVPPADQKTCTMKGEESPNSSAEGSCLKALGGATAGSTDSEGPIVHRVMHLSGYNYGVPQTYVRPSCTEKDGTWTDSDKIRVCVRKRPLGLREERRGEVSVVTVEDKETIAIYEKKEAVNLKEYILQHVFYFDEVFSETFTNQDVYMRTAHPLIRHVFNGGNATCFAYGQTGAGKTYTMIGTPKNPGLYALAAKDIFQQLETNQQKKDHSVWISFYEIYCGQLYDLLNGRKRLYAREDGKHVVQVVGLREVQVKSVDFLLEVILKGSRERSTGATGVNSDSSRSHAVIQIQIKDVGNRKLGRMSFIDLAGSERASDARESDKQTKMEGAEINQSLLALKECIRALDQEQAHTPFRQSKLTQVLKDSFIGNSKTCMIANISPSHIATEHTLNTLRYADRVKELKKGMKCTTSCNGRGRSAPCLSPKRGQNSPSVLGEKISPKKVKLGLSSSSSTIVKHKSCPSVFHPTNVPLSSTPKICTKPNTGGRGCPTQAWLTHTTPVKGTMKTGKKKSESHDKIPTPRNPHSVKADMGIEPKEDRSRQPLQRVQAVQPVQKQIVSRGGMFTDITAKMWDAQDDPTCRKTGGENRGLPEQKEREEHLRYYHQQIQHPPILLQKLHYQPLEKILDQYKPQEVTVGHVRSAASQREETPVEDPDDSDFSEDSFSFTSNQKKGRKEEMVRERLSFFLHQGTPSLEVRKVSGIGQGLHYHLSESKENKSMITSKCGCGLSDRKRAENGDHTMWSSEEESTSSLDNTGRTPEKPYSSQEDLENEKKTIKNSPLSRKSSTEFNPLQERCNQTVSLNGSPITGPKFPEGRSPAANTSCETAMMAPLTVSLLKDNWSLDSTYNVEPHDLSGVGDGSSSAISDKAMVVESHTEDQSVEKNLSDLVKKMLRYNESLHIENSQCRGKNWFPDSSFEPKSSSADSPQFLIQSDLAEKNSPRLGQSPASGKNDFYISDSFLDFSQPKCRDQTSHFYDADTEDSSGNVKTHGIVMPSLVFGRKQLKEAAKDHSKHSNTSPTNVSADPLYSSGVDSDSFKLPLSDNELEHLKNRLMEYIFTHCGAKEKQTPKCVLIREDQTPRKTPASSGLLQSPCVSSQEAKMLEKAQQVVIQAHCKQLNEMSALSSQEEMLLNHTSSSDFQEYVKKLDEILTLKCKQIENLRAQLQKFLDQKPTEFMALDDCVCCS